MDDILIKYWSQFLLILGIIGYFGQRIFDAKDKKNETRFQLYQTNKATAIENFLGAYSKLVLFWHNIPFYNILENKFSPKEIDEMILPKIEEFKKTIIILQFYLNAEKIKAIKVLEDRFANIYFNLQHTYFQEQNINSFEKGAKFRSFQEEELKGISKHFAEICEQIKEDFTTLNN